MPRILTDEQRRYRNSRTLRNRSRTSVSRKVRRALDPAVQAKRLEYEEQMVESDANISAEEKQLSTEKNVALAETSTDKEVEKHSSIEVGVEKSQQPQEPLCISITQSNNIYRRRVQVYLKESQVLNNEPKVEKEIQNRVVLRENRTNSE